MEDWADFFVAEAGAAAALAGLLFVAISINLTRILEFRNLPFRALEALIAFVSVLAIATVGLTPNQTPRTYGIAFVAIALITLGIQTLSWVKSQKLAKAYDPSLIHALRNLVPPLPFLAAGLAVAGDAPGGELWITVGTLLSFASGLIGAWVLLVEIQR